MKGSSMRQVSQKLQRWWQQAAHKAAWGHRYQHSTAAIHPSTNRPGHKVVRDLKFLHRISHILLHTSCPGLGVLGTLKYGQVTAVRFVWEYCCQKALNMSPTVTAGATMWHPACVLGLHVKAYHDGSPQGRGEKAPLCLAWNT